MAWATGDGVEVAGMADDGFPSSWMGGVVTAEHHKPSSIAGVPDVTVTFPEFVEDDGGELKERLPATSLRLRPAPPEVAASLDEYQPGESVDVEESTIWWQAVVCGRMIDRKSKRASSLHIYYTGSKEYETVEDVERVRPGRIWAGGLWHTRPLPDDLPHSVRRKVQQATAQAAAATTTNNPAPGAEGRSVPEVVRKHNAGIKADAAALAGQRFAFLDENLDVLRPFITNVVAADIHSRAARARGSEGLPTLPEPVQRQPEVITGPLREYQLEGIRWMVGCFHRGVNAILADEMGLGKTVQTISYLAHLKFEKGVEGPHLVVVPLSVLPSWLVEFERWCPRLRVVRLHTSDDAERARLRHEVLNRPDTFDVAVTTYDSVRSKDFGQALTGVLHWRCLVLDEGHRIKNEGTMLAQAMRGLKAQHKMLLSGTPLQNNLHELWALLGFLHPDVFTSSEAFDEAFDLSTHVVDMDRLEQAGRVLRAFSLRRVKEEVELTLPPMLETRVLCPLTQMQTFWYRRLLLRNAPAVRQLEAEVEGKVKFAAGDNTWKRLISLVMQLRKIVNHPYLLPGAEPDFDGGTGEDIVKASGKLAVLDRLLAKLKQRGHRVVIFSQFNRQLDVLEDYLNLRGHTFARLDGSTNRVQRMIDMRMFNKPGSDLFCYLLNTRAGGLGVNLQTADTVVMYDSDWNPQVDLQAMARVHRIGQTRPVHAYRLCTEGTIEERIQYRAERKLLLGSAVIGSGTGTELVASLGKTELLSLLQYGADRVFKSEQGRAPTEKELEAILDRSTTAQRAAAAATARAATQAPGVGLEGEGQRGAQGSRGGRRSSSERGAVRTLQNVRASAAEMDVGGAPLSSYVFQGADYREKSMREIGQEFWAQQPAPRDRKQRVVMVDGHPVLSLNMYDLDKGEPSIYDASTGRDAAAARPGQGGQRPFQKAGRDYLHFPVCNVCWSGGEDLVTCSRCPGSYHLGCLGLGPDEATAHFSGWTCPAHSCVVCLRKAGAVGGMLFRCEGCPRSFCEDHMPEEADVLGTSTLFEEDRGWCKPSTACFVRCSGACAAVAAAAAGPPDDHMCGGPAAAAAKQGFTPVKQEQQQQQQRQVLQQRQTHVPQGAVEQQQGVMPEKWELGASLGGPVKVEQAAAQVGAGLVQNRPAERPSSGRQARLSQLMAKPGGSGSAAAGGCSASTKKRAAVAQLERGSGKGARVDTV